MDNRKNIIGVVLAGGQSSRMGSNKALLDYKGKPLLRHMVNILKETGLTDIYVSGNFEGYNCIPDSEPLRGPAHAINNILKQLNSHDGILFIPIDMPLLTPDILNILLEQDNGGYFINQPLPALIKTSHSNENNNAVKKLLQSLNVPTIPLTPHLNEYMVNTNTPEDWQKVLSS